MTDPPTFGSELAKETKEQGRTGPGPVVLAPCLSALYKPNPQLGEGLWKHVACSSAPEHLGDLGRGSPGLSSSISLC